MLTGGTGEWTNPGLTHNTPLNPTAFAPVVTTSHENFHATFRCQQRLGGRSKKGNAVCILRISKQAAVQY